MDFYKNGLKLATVLLLVVGCQKSDDNNNRGGGGTPKPTVNPSAPNSFGGEDIKNSFVDKFARANYQLGDHGGRIQGLGNGKERLHINSDGSYFLIVHGVERPLDENRSVRCNVEESGMITQVRKVANMGDNVTIGKRNIGTAGIGGYLVLQPMASNVTDAETIVKLLPQAQPSQPLPPPTTPTDIQPPPAGKDEPVVSELNEDEVNKACGRTEPRTILVQEFLDQALVLSVNPLDASENNNATDTSTNTVDLSDRLLIRDGVEWLWFSGALANELVQQTTPVLTAGRKGLEIEGDNVNALENRSGERNLISRVSFTESANHIALQFGTSVKEDFLPIIEVYGNLLGVSYSPKEKEVVYNLENYNVTQVPVSLNGVGLNPDIQNTLKRAQGDIGPHVGKLNAESTQKILKVGFKLDENEDVKVSSAVKSVPLETLIPRFLSR